VVQVGSTGAGPRGEPQVAIGAILWQSSGEGMATDRSGGEILKRVTALAGALALALCPAALTRAAGPIFLEGTTGLPPKWDNSAPVTYRIETGRLNTDLDNSAAADLVDESFATWTGLPSVDLSTGRGTSLGLDITGANAGSFFDNRDGVTPVIFDEDGAITDLVFGNDARNSVLGFAAPEFFQSGTSTITEGIAVMNGSLIAGSPRNATKTLFVHEFGHMLGVGHSQLHGQLLVDGDGSNQSAIPIMFPFLRSTSDNNEVAAVPTLDDEVSMSFLYPKANFLTRGGNISGRVFKTGNEFRGANVIVRSQSDPLNAVVTWPSGMHTKTGAPWEVHLLPPGSYTVEVEPIDPRFTGGSSIGQFDPPPAGVTNEFFNGTAESGDPSLDRADERTVVSVVAGQSVGPIDVVINESAVALNPGAENSGTIQRTGTINETDGALPSFQFSVPVGETNLFLTVAVAQTNGVPIDLFVRRGQAVGAGQTAGTFVADASVSGAGNEKQLRLSRTTSPQLLAGTYFVALVNRGSEPADFQLTASVNSPIAASTTGGPGGGSGGCSGRPGAGGDPADVVPLLLPLAAALVLRRRARE
jgi:hypothetical protein